MLKLPKVGKKFRSRVDAIDHQMVAGTDASDVKQVAFKVVGLVHVARADR